MTVEWEWERERERDSEINSPFLYLPLLFHFLFRVKDQLCYLLTKRWKKEKSLTIYGERRNERGGIKEELRKERTKNWNDTREKVKSLNKLSQFLFFPSVGDARTRLRGRREGGGGWKRQGRYGGRGEWGGEESRGGRVALPLGWVPALGLRWRQVERSGRCGGRVWCHLEPSACGLGNTWSANSPSAKPSERRLLLSRAVFIRYLSRTKKNASWEREKKNSGEVCREIFVFYCEQPNVICGTWASSENMTSPKKSTRLFWLFFSHLFSVTTWMQHQKAMEISLQHLPLAMNYPFVLGVDIHTYTYRFRCGLDLCRNNAQSIERKRRAHRNLPCRQLPHSVQKLAGVNV